MDEWIVILRMAVLGFILTLSLGHFGDLVMGRPAKQAAQERICLSVAAALFAWIMGWLG